MSGMIIELQKESWDSSVKTSDLLRKALATAKKLDIVEFEKWVSCEMNGYKEQDNIPEYRILSGRIVMHNSYKNSYETVMFPESATEDYRGFSQRKFFQSISKLEFEINGAINNNVSELFMEYSPQQQNMLMKATGSPFAPRLIVPVSSLERILDSVRNNILNWALELEKKGIIGEGFQFSDKEKESASNIFCNIKNVTNLQIQAGISSSSQSMEIKIDKQEINNFVKELENSLTELSLGSDDAQEIDTKIATIKAQVKSPKPKRDVLKSSFQAIKRILGRVTESALTQKLLESISSINII